MGGLTASVAGDPSGRFACAATCGGTSHLAQYAIGAGGSLTPMSAGPVATGNGPYYVLATW